jgi:rubrerythrin
MSRPTCSCDSLERLEGASVPAYVKAFLEQQKKENPRKNRYRCRICGRAWEKQTPANDREGTRPSLVRLG